jgi:hypothetical protein
MALDAAQLVVANFGMVPHSSFKESGPSRYQTSARYVMRNHN